MTVFGSRAADGVESVRMEVPDAGGVTITGVPAPSLQVMKIACCPTVTQDWHMPHPCQQ